MLFYLTIAFLFGYIVAQFRKNISISSDIISFCIDAISMVKIFVYNNSNSKILSSIHNDRLIIDISTTIGYGNGISHFLIRSIKTNHHIKVKGIHKNNPLQQENIDNKKDEDDLPDLIDDENDNDIKIGHYEKYYFGLDISPQSLGYEKFEITITPYIGKAEPRIIDIEDNVTLYDFFTNTPSSLVEFENIHYVKHKHIDHIDKDSEKQE